MTQRREEAVTAAADPRIEIPLSGDLAEACNQREGGCKGESSAMRRRGCEEKEKKGWVQGRSLSHEARGCEKEIHPMNNHTSPNIKNHTQHNMHGIHLLI